MDLELHKAVKGMITEIMKPQPSLIEVHLGVIVSEEPDGTCTITLQGVDDQISGIRKLQCRTPDDAVCVVQRSGADWLILGCLDDGVAGPEIVGAFKSTPAAGLTTEADVMGTGSIPAFTVPLNRILRIEFHCGSIQQNAAGGFVKVKLTDGSNTGLGLFGQQSLATADRWSINGVLRFSSSIVTSAAAFTLNATAPIQLKVRAFTSAGNVDFNGTNNADPGPMWFRVIDEGRL